MPRRLRGRHSRVRVSGKERLISLHCDPLCTWSSNIFKCKLCCRRENHARLWNTSLHTGTRSVKPPYLCRLRSLALPPASVQEEPGQTLNPLTLQCLSRT